MIKCEVPVYVVAHPAFKERYKYILRHLVQRGVHNPTVVGVVGREVLESVGGEIHRKDLSAGQIGCSLSHVAAYRHMVEHRISKAIVVEDDANLPAEFFEICREVLHVLRDGEIISLHSPTMQRRELSRLNSNSIGGHALVTPLEVRALRSTLCYAIDVNAARRMAEINNPVKFVADDFVSFYNQGCVKFVRLLSPSVALVEPFPSTIGYMKRGGVGRYLSKFLNKTPVVSHMLRIRRRRLRLRREGNHILVDKPSKLSEANPSYVE